MNPLNDTTGNLAVMCQNNFKLSKKIAKIHIKNLSSDDVNNLDKALTAVGTFLLIKDGLQKTRLEWIFGISLTKVIKKEGPKNKKFEYYGRDYI